MEEFDVIIRGGMVIDGARLPRSQADVDIKYRRSEVRSAPLCVIDAGINRFRVN